MENKKPDFRAIREGVSVWKQIDRDGNEYLNVSIGLLGKTVRCFAPKEEGLVHSSKKEVMKDD